MTETEPTPQSHPWLYALSGRGGGIRLNRYLDNADETALKKSWDLLLEHLTPQQTRDLVTNGRYTVTASDGTRELTIHADWHHVNVYDHANGLRYCTVTYGRVPLWDHILSQTLAIRYNYPYFHSLAIKSHLYDFDILR